MLTKSKVISSCLITATLASTGSPVGASPIDTINFWGDVSSISDSVVTAPYSLSLALQGTGKIVQFVPLSIDFATNGEPARIGLQYTSVGEGDEKVYYFFLTGTFFFQTNSKELSSIRTAIEAEHGPIELIAGDLSGELSLRKSISDGAHEIVRGEDGEQQKVDFYVKANGTSGIPFTFSFTVPGAELAEYFSDDAESNFVVDANRVFNAKTTYYAVALTSALSEHDDDENEVLTLKELEQFFSSLTTSTPSWVVGELASKTYGMIGPPNTSFKDADGRSFSGWRLGDLGDLLLDFDAGTAFASSESEIRIPVHISYSLGDLCKKYSQSIVDLDSFDTGCRFLSVDEADDGN